MARHARVQLGNEIFEVTVAADNGLLTADGRNLPADDVRWLPPATGTMLALGLNYADHASELKFKAPPKEPLIFVKTPQSYTGHGEISPRPDDVDYMHYEGELVVVIGKPATRVPRANAMDYVGGYTICNDYAVRDFLENYYRPNLRVKCRESLTPIGPYIVDAADVPDPHALSIRTLVNGTCHQQGNTRDMIFDIPFLIEYITEFMTLMPGDMIATGTPQGLIDVKPGDVVDVEIEHVGSLRNHVVSAADFVSEAARRLHR